MLFASVELAARIERAECSLLEECAASAATRAGAEPFVRRLAGGVAVHLGPGSPLNKIAGLGFGGPVDAAELEAVEREHARRDAPVQAVVATLGDPSVTRTLTSRGYRLAEFEHVLGRELDDEALHPPPPPAGIAVATSDAGAFPVWLDTMVTGFAAPDTQGVPPGESFPRELLEKALRDTTLAGGFARYLARRGGEPAGAAGMRLCEGVAQLCGAATLPEHRRRGVQSALLAARLADAVADGADVAVVTTQPGSTSQQNVQHLGFELLYARAVLVLEPA